MTAVRSMTALRNFVNGQFTDAASDAASDVVSDVVDPSTFPPEPVRSAGIGVTRWSLAQANRRDGRRNTWLRALDSIGLGFDS